MSGPGILQTGPPTQCRDIYDAIVKNDRDAVEWFIASGVDVNGTSETGNTPLHHAISFGRIELVKYLLSHGAMPGVRNGNNETPLHRAVEKRGERLSR
ncbi:MAG: ankyrin repeat domain-containing protein [Vulcanimicrobiota bacterium]